MGMIFRTSYPVLEDSCCCHFLGTGCNESFKKTVFFLGKCCYESVDKTVLIYHVPYVIDFVCSITATGNCSSEDTELQRYPLLAEMYIEDIPLPRDGTKHSNTIVLTASRARRYAESFRCQRCGNFYTYKKNLLRHLNLECGKEPQFQCPYCPKKAKHKNHLLRHIKSQHAENV